MDPSDVRDLWADRTGAYSPDYYAHHGPNETSESIRDVLDPLGTDARILELGCSAGRHLAHLHESGFDRLHGVDVNEDAVEVMAATYPDLAAEGTFYVDAFEDVLPEFEDDRFDAVYSVETLQHVHPEGEWVFEEVARIASDRVVTVETEGDEADREGEGVNYVAGEVPLYYRDWEAVFTDLGLEQVDRQSPRRGTLRVFESP